MKHTERSDSILNDPAFSESNRNTSNSELESAIILLGLGIMYLLLPLVVFVFTLIMVISLFYRQKKSLTLAAMVIFFLSYLIATRYVGEVWGGSDDMASYFLAYERFTSFREAHFVSLRYLKSLDYLFVLYSTFVSIVLRLNNFGYYFVTVAGTLVISYYAYEAIVGRNRALLSLALYVFYFKAFHLQWHIIRAAIAIPILALGVATIADRRIVKGALLFLIGFGFHAATAILFIPLYLYGPQIDDPGTMQNRVTYLIRAAGFLSVGVTLMWFLGHYGLDKVMSALSSVRITFNHNARFILPFWLLYSVKIIAHLRLRRRYLERMVLYFCLVSLAATFFVPTQVFYRYAHPFLFLQPLVVMLVLNSFRPQFLGYFVYASLIFFAFMYVIFLNETSFFFLGDVTPSNINGLKQLELLHDYIGSNVPFYDGFRMR